jgi:hypothetical protein
VREVPLRRPDFQGVGRVNVSRKIGKNNSDGMPPLSARAMLRRFKRHPERLSRLLVRRVQTVMDLPPDYSNPLRNTLVFGSGSCGKTSLCIRALINIPWACAFIFDLNGQFSRRLKTRWAGTAAECEDALASRWVCFNPHRMFDADETDAAFNWFCDWAFKKSKLGPGRKVLVADDSWEFSAARTLTKELARVVKLGRFWHLEFFGVTHRPMEYNIAIRGLVTEWIGFNTLPQDTECVKDYWPGVVACATLPKFEFVAFNRDSRVERRFKLPPP